MAKEKEAETIEKEAETIEKEPEKEAVKLPISKKDIDTEDLSEKVAQKIQQKINREKNEKAQKVNVETDDENVKDNPSFVISLFSVVVLVGIAIFSILKLRKSPISQQPDNPVGNSASNSIENTSVISRLVKG